MNSFLKISFVFIGLILPLCYLSNTLDPALTPRFLALTIYTACAIIFFSLNKQHYIFTKNNSIIFFIFLLFIVSGIISSLNAIAIPDSIYGLSKYITFLLFLFIINQLLVTNFDNTLSKILQATAVFSVIAILGGIYHIYKAMLIDNSFNPYWITSLFTHKNLYSSILLILLPFNMYLLFTSTKLWRFTSSINLTGSVFFILILASRATWLGLAAMTSLFFIGIITKKIILPPTTLKSDRNQLFYGIALFCLAISPFVISQHTKIAGSIFEKSSHITSESRENIKIQSNYNPKIHEPGSVETRTILWKKSLQIFKEHPVIGIGVENWRVQYGKFNLNNLDYLARQGYKHFQRPHNDFLVILTEQGLLGIFLFISLLLYIGIIAFTCITTSTNTNKKLLVYLLCIMLCGIGIVSFFDFPKERIEHTVLLLIAIAIIVSIGHNKKSNVYKPSKPLNVCITLVIILLIPFIITIASKRMQGEINTQLLNEAKEYNNNNDILHYANKATNIAYSIDPISCSMNYYKGTAYFNMQQIDSALICFKAAEKETPYHIHNLNNIATSYVLQKQLDSAELVYLKTLNVSSDYEDALINIAAFYFNQQQYSNSYKYIKTCNYKSIHKNYKQTLTAILSVLISDKIKHTANPQAKAYYIQLLQNNSLLLNKYVECVKANKDFVLSI